MEEWGEDRPADEAASVVRTGKTAAAVAVATKDVVRAAPGVDDHHATDC